ncbi:MAG: hypothetical protein K8L97_33565 [Anaerolineae bacterium]|nr:hypothetical protein [Anaerolineae bacterium]
MSKKGIIREKDRQIAEQAAKIERLRQELSLTKALTPVMDRIAKQQLFVQGYDAAIDNIIEYIDPIIKHTVALNMIAGQIYGAALSGQGKLAIQNMKEYTEALGAFISKLDLQITRAVERYGEDFRETVPIDKFVELYEAAKEYYASGNKDALSDLIRSKSPFHAELVNMRPNFQTGAKRKPQITNQWLFEQAEMIHSQAQGQLQWDGVAEILLKRLESSSYDDTQLIQLGELKGTSDKATYLRQGVSRLRKRRKA